MSNFDRDFRRYSFSRVKRLVIISLITGLASSVAALVVVSFFRDIAPQIYACPIIAAVAAYISHTSKTLKSLWISASVVLFASTVCVGALASAWGEPTLWFLPIGLIVTIPAAAATAQLSQYLPTILVIWLTLFFVMQPEIFHQDYLVPALLIAFYGLAAAVVICRELYKDRHNIFQLQKKLHEIAYIDSLTGLPNRRAFMEFIKENEGSTKPESMIYFYMLDIDDFKKINDSHGHDIGDEVLIQVAEIIGRISIDHNAGRLGGEEFAIFAYLSGAEAAKELGQSLIEAVSSTEVLGINVTISVGIAELRASESIAHLMRRSDLALYRAKESGKNRYEIA